jgi:hypothetical protein
MTKENPETSSAAKSDIKEEDTVEMSTKVSLSFGKLEAFDYSDESKNTASIRWTKWIRDFKTYCIANNVTDAEQKKAVLLLMVGEDVRDIYYASENTEDDFNAVVTKLNKYFEPHKNTVFQVFQFDTMFQNDTESLAEYVTRLRHASKSCEFKDVDAELARQVIRGCASARLKEEILKNKLKTVDEMLDLARNGEAAREQAKLISEATKLSLF